jgi:cellulose synthase/poly-beta-1,6-N-acetylglucosamine synthase-like glycosyltransferase
MLDQGEVAGKSRAICRGLEVVGTDWVLLVDSDIQLHPGAIDALLAWASGRPAAYGLIASAPAREDLVLASVVISDKFASHGVLRLGRLALGLWPNIPGQCYLVRTDVLRAVYDEDMGHLDDLAVTLKLCGINGGPACALQILGAEEGRQSWCGLVAQRTRWTIGLVQSLGVIRSASQHRRKMIACWVLHAGLYYGEPLAVCGTMLASAVTGRWRVAGAILCGHVLIGLLVSLVGRANVVALDPAHAQKPIPVTYVALGSLVIMGAHCIGAVLAPIMWIASRSYSRPNARVLYWR